MRTQNCVLSTHQTSKNTNVTLNSFRSWPPGRATRRGTSRDALCISQVLLDTSLFLPWRTRGLFTFDWYACARGVNYLSIKGCQQVKTINTYVRVVFNYGVELGWKAGLIFFLAGSLAPCKGWANCFDLLEKLGEGRTASGDDLVLNLCAKSLGNWVGVCYFNFSAFFFGVWEEDEVGQM